MYWIRYHIPRHLHTLDGVLCTDIFTCIGLGVTYQHTNSLGVNFVRGPLVTDISYLFVIDNVGLYVSLELITYVFLELITSIMHFMYICGLDVS